jgi:tRNA 2-selenouridine synthase
MRHHYDPRYEKHRARFDGTAVEIAAESLTPEALDGLAAKVAGAVAQLAP